MTGANRQQLEDAAIEWIARLRASDVTDAERADFATWLAESPAHAEAFDAMIELWNLTGNLEVAEASQIASTSTGEAAVVRLPARTASFKQAWPLALAATVALSLGIMLFQPGGIDYETDTGEQRRVVLSDGTTVHLNTQSQLTVEFDGRRRAVRLEGDGEAFFDVTRDARRPFTVTTEDGRIEVLGTAFNVRTSEDQTVVAVTEGRVRLDNNAGDSAVATPSQRGVVSEQGIALDHVSTEQIASWRSGRLMYDSVPLGDLISDLNRYLPKPMSLADEHLTDVPVSAVLQLQPQDDMLDALSESLGLRWTEVSDNLILLQER